MAVVKKTSETRSRAAAKATIRYIMHRPELGEKITRPLFGFEEGDDQKLNAYNAIDKAPKGTRFLRVAISPDPKREDTYRDLNLRELTRQTMQTLAKKYKGQSVRFFASEHAGHTDKRHVNLLVLVPPGRLTRGDWKNLRETASANAREQRLALDKEQGRTIGNGYIGAQRSIRTSRLLERSVFTRVGSARAPSLQCPVCRGDLSRHGRLLECHNCALSFSGGKYIGLQIERQQLELGQEVGSV
jgi:hypothetical protein